ncbi:MAG: hypothetical protein AB7G23_06390 [Vicinamibacterales bacterium]
MDAQIFIGKIHIIEWLRDSDRRTGWELFGEVEPMGIVSNPRVDVAFYRVATRDAFIDVIRAIENEFRRTSRLPLLHIETHGNDDGIGIAADNGFTFLELMEELIPLNGLTGLRLLVVLAACHGIWGMKMFQPATRSAALAIIGPHRKVDDDEVARGLQAFYRGMFAHRGGDRAIQEMNDAIKPGEMTFGALHAELLFKKVYREFHRQLCTPESIERRLDAMIPEWHAQARIDFGRDVTDRELERARALARHHLEAHDGNFADFRRHYFWMDQFPDNEGRFPVTLADCVADGE